MGLLGVLGKAVGGLASGVAKKIVGGGGAPTAPGGSLGLARLSGVENAMSSGDSSGTLLARKAMTGRRLTSRR